MTKESREIVRTAIMGLALMMVIPISYRVWRWYNPQAESKHFSLTGFLEKSSGDRAVALLKLPISKWTDYDKKSEPKIYAWLQAHEKVVLPWEWTEEARKKDPEGYRKLWLKLFKEQESELKSKLKSEQKKLKSLDREIWIAETIYTHRTNQLARVKAYVATNTFPMTITVERLSKGRLWGWNTKFETIEIGRRENQGGISNGWFRQEGLIASEERIMLVDRMSVKRHSLAKVEALRQFHALANSRAAAVTRSQCVIDVSTIKDFLYLLRGERK